MIEDLNSYPEMKSSGVLWLGDVPSHWAVQPNRALFTEQKVCGLPEEPLLSVTIGRGIITQSALLANSSKKDSSNLDRTKYKLVEPGDIAYNKMRAWQGAIGASSFRGIVSPAYVVMRPRPNVNTRYYHEVFRTPAFATEAERWSYGITSDQWSLRPQHFKMIYCPRPPDDEQRAILLFLAHADKKIAHYIQVKKRLISLLEEQRQIFLGRAVTQGFGAPLAMKSSNTEFLPDIPKEWDVLPLRRRWQVVDCKHLTVPFSTDGIPLASVREVQGFDLNLSTANRTTPDWANHLLSGGRNPKRGELIYCRNVAVGASAYINTDEIFAMGQDVCLIKSNTENNRFLNYFLHSPAMKRQLSLLLIGSTFNRINISTIKTLFIAVPPREEQDEIVEQLDRSLIQFDAPISQAEREIQALREYRSRLFSEVALGKMDVRQAAARLPEEARPWGDAAHRDAADRGGVFDGAAVEGDEDLEDAALSGGEFDATEQMDGAY